VQAEARREFEDTLTAAEESMEEAHRHVHLEASLRKGIKVRILLSKFQ